MTPKETPLRLIRPTKERDYSTRYSHFEELINRKIDFSSIKDIKDHEMARNSASEIERKINKFIRVFESCTFSFYEFFIFFFFAILNNTENLIERNDCFIEPFLLSVPPLIFVNIARANIESKVFLPRKGKRWRVTNVKFNRFVGIGCLQRNRGLRYHG